MLVLGTACTDDPPTDAPAPDAAAPGPGGDADAGPSGPGDVTALRVTPSQVSLVTDGVAAAEATVAVVAVRGDGTETDVTGSATYLTEDASVVTASAGRLQSGLRGGRARIEVSYRGQRTSVDVTVRLERTLMGPAVGDPLPADPTRVFDDAPEDTGRAPRLVYPNDGVLLPPNLGSVEVHYVPASAQDTLFELTFASPIAAVRVPTRCRALEGGCVFDVDGELWGLLAETHAGRDAVTLRVRATDDEGRGVGASAEIAVRFAYRPVLGGLYYWTTSNGTGIMRTEFGDGTPPERFFPFEGGGCYGCHSLSRDGRKMTVSQNGQRDGRMTLVDVGAQSALRGPSDGFREQFQSWDPTSTQFAGIYGDDDPPDTNIRIRDGTSGDVLETIPLGFEPTHPDWSPRGDRIIVTQVTIHQTSQRPGRGGLAYVERVDGAWSAPRELIAPQDGFNRYYPAYAPGGEFVVYNESICPNGENYTAACDGDADDVAKLFAIGADGGASISLDRVNAPGVADEGETNLANTFPKWAPFVDPQNREGGRLMWFTFSSRRQYGLRSPSGRDQLLWMAALDPDAVLAGRDGSFAAFALPFQDLTTSNHIAQWTTRIVPTEPTDGGVDPGGRNDGGACLEIGSVCTPGSNECCSGLSCLENGPSVYVCRPDL